MRSEYQVLIDGAKLARDSMRQDAREWRLLVVIGARSEYCRAMLERAISARRISKHLEYCAQQALAREVGF